MIFNISYNYCSIPYYFDINNWGDGEAKIKENLIYSIIIEGEEKILRSIKGGKFYNDNVDGSRSSLGLRWIQTVTKDSLLKK